MKVQVNFRCEREAVDYLKAIGEHGDRSLSYLINKALEHVIEKHSAARKGDQASLEILRVLGSKPNETTNGN